MSFIDFRAEYKVYIRSMDYDHELVAKIVNSLHDSVVKADRALMRIEMNKLLEVLEGHFENEEMMMKENRFPSYFSHKLEHDRFYRQMLKTIERFDKDKESFGMNELHGLRRWFFNHIEINDRKCGQFLTDKGFL
ncbi:hypothetical protein C0389_05160 [bacterium]|nr:hypothetical protein [bacterium]